MHNQPAQTAIVTGAASGMGRSVVMALANAGLEVLAADLNVSAATETAHMATGAGGGRKRLKWMCLRALR